MDDSKIVELYFSRNEEAITRTQLKYGRYCQSIAYGILRSDEDAKECENDTYLRAWNAIPPQRPLRLSAFLGRITRNLALDRYDVSTAKKRAAADPLPLDEIAECVPDTSDTPMSDENALREAINGFLGSLPTRTRIVFMRRYWYFSTVEEIARDLEMSESNVKVTLMRTRTRFKEYLTRKGIQL